MVPSNLTLASPLNSKLPGLELACIGLRKPALKLRRFPISSGLQVFSFKHPDKPIALPPPANQDVAAILLGDGSEARLWPLTKRRSAAAIPIAVNYRLIDVVVSNCINSNITKMFALTQFNSTSLNAHLYRAYSRMGLGKDEFLEVIAAYQSPEHHGWFQGNADAIRRCLALLEEHPVTEFLILPGHQLYKMDYNKLIQAHQRSKADITISCVKAGKDDQDRGFGCLRANSEDLVLRIKDTMQDHTTFPAASSNEDAGCNTLTSMGIYVISKQVIIRILREYFPFANDFRREVIPGAISLGMKVKAYVFEGYWDGMDSISSFYNASMSITKQEEDGFSYNFYDRDCPLYTLPRCLPPSKISNALINNSVIGDGCVLDSCRINDSVLGLRTRVGYGAVVEDSIILGSDSYEESIVASNREINVSIGIGEGALVRKAIIDKNARIGKRVMIINKDNVQEGSREDHNFAIVDGIVVVMRSAIIPDGTIL